MNRLNGAKNLSSQQIPSNQALTLGLSGQGAQLGNQSGPIHLLDAHDQLIHEVTYKQEQAIIGEKLVF